MTRGEPSESETRQTKSHEEAIDDAQDSSEKEYLISHLKFGPALTSGAELTLLLSQAAASPDVKSSPITTASESTYPRILSPEEIRRRMVRGELDHQLRLDLVHARRVTRGYNRYSTTSQQDSGSASKYVSDSRLGWRRVDEATEARGSVVEGA